MVNLQPLNASKAGSKSKVKQVKQVLKKQATQVKDKRCCRGKRKSARAQAPQEQGKSAKRSRSAEGEGCMVWWRQGRLRGSAEARIP
jgi:hypothetical protein